MDSNSPLKTREGINEEDGTSQVDKMDLNSYQTKKEYGVDDLAHEGQMLHEELQVYSNEGYASPPILVCEVNEEEKHYKLESTLEGSSFPMTGLEKSKREGFSYGIESMRSPYEEHEHDGDIITTVKVDIGDLIHHHQSSLDRGDNDVRNLTDREYYDKPIAKSSTLDDGTNHNYNKLSVDPQLKVNEVNKEMNDKNNAKFYHQSQMRVGDYSYDMATPENVRMVWENSCLQSQETQNVSPSPERRLSASAELSPCTQSPPKGYTSPERRLSASLSAPSPPSSRRRHSPSSQKPSSGGKGAPSSDRSSLSRRPKSPSERELKRETRHKIYSPRRHLSQSPQKHDSPQRRGRSKSKSPTRRRGSSGRHKDHRRSRSRSPLARNHNRRSPRRQSPRRRSPPNYHSRQHPSRRPWSPPTNRNTGIGRPGKNLFIAGFSYLTTERDLKKKFSKFGHVTDARVVRDRRSGDSRGFGFLSLERDEDADAAIRAVDQTEWNGRVVLVEKSKTSR